MKWIKCNQTWDEFCRDHEDKITGELPVGLYFKESNGDTHLIGDINHHGGVCDDCRFALVGKDHIVSWCILSLDMESDK